MKPIKGLKNAHTSNSKIGMGDFYGSGVRQSVGRMRESMIDGPVKSKKSGNPPKSLA